MRQLFPTIGILLGALLAPTVALADEPDLTLRFEPGVAIPMTGPQADRFNVGGQVTLKPMIGILPLLDVGPSVTATALPSDVDGVDAGVAWGVGAGARVKRPRDYVNNTDTGLAAISPWLDGDFQYVRTGDLNRFGLMLGAGASAPTSDSRQLWVGPYVRYTDVVQSLVDRPGFDNTDAHVFTIGLSIEVGPKAKKNVAECGEPCGDRDGDGVINREDRCPDEPGPASNQGCPLPTPEAKKPPPPPLPPVVPVPAAIRQRVQFDFDSAVITSDAASALGQVLQVLHANPTWHVEIRGHASSDGPLEHNKKLAQRRAESVLVFLKGQGIAGDRMVAKGLGIGSPVSPNSTEAGRVANRRVDFDVDFVIVKNGGAK